MKKKVVKKTKATGGHLKHMGHGTDDMTMIIIAGGAFIVMVVVVILTGQMVTSGHRTAVAQVSASGSSR
jgi:hypothetical protein